MLLEAGALVPEVVILREWAAEIRQPNEGFQLIQTGQGQAELEVQTANQETSEETGQMRRKGRVRLHDRAIPKRSPDEIRSRRRQFAGVAGTVSRCLAGSRTSVYLVISAWHASEADVVIRQNSWLRQPWSVGAAGARTIWWQHVP